MTCSILINIGLLFAAITSSKQVVVFIDEIFPKGLQQFVFTNDLKRTSHDSRMPKNEVEKLLQKIPSNLVHLSILFTLSH